MAQPSQATKTKEPFPLPVDAEQEATSVMNLMLMDPPRWGWAAIGSVSDLLTPHEVSAWVLAGTSPVKSNLILVGIDYRYAFCNRDLAGEVPGQLIERTSERMLQVCR